MYLFYLYHPDLKKPERIPDPVGWKPTGRKFVRDIKTHGVSFVYTPKLQFIKRGRAILHYFYERDFIHMNVTLLVYKKSKSSRRAELIYQGKVNAAKGFEVGTVDITCNIEQTGFLQKFKNGQDVKVDLLGNTSQDGKAVNSFSTINVDLPSKIVLKRLHRDKPYLDDLGGVQTVQFSVDSGEVWYIILSFDQTSLSLDEIGERWGYGLQASQLDPVESGKYILLCDDDGTYRFNFDCIHRFLKEDPMSGSLDLVVVYGKPGAYTEVVVGHNTDLGTEAQQFDDNFSINIKKGDEIYIFYKLTASATPDNNSIIFTEDYIITEEPFPSFQVSEITIDAETTFPDSVVPVMTVHDAFARVVEFTTDKKNSFRSTYYGLTDSDPVGYDQDGPGSERAIATGKLVRGFPLSENHPYTNFKNLYENMRAVDGVGFGVRRIEGREVIEVELPEFFYSKRKLISLPFVRDLKKSPYDPLIANELLGGYDKSFTEAIGDLDEFNTSREYSLPVTELKNKPDLKASFITSSYLWENVRRDNYSISSTKSNDHDDDIFLLQLRRAEGNLVVDRDEDFALLQGVLFPETIINAKLSPMRNIIRNGSTLRAGLWKRTDKNISVTEPKGNVDFTSRLNTETETVNEKTIAISKLKKPFVLPEVYSFKYPVTESELTTIESDPYAFIEFATDGKTWKRGYILEAEPDTESDLTKFKLIRANL